MLSRLFLTVATAAILLAPLSLLHAEETLQQRYLDVFIKMHDAETLEKNGDYAGALKGFQDCSAALVAIRNSDADWESAIVGHRLADCQVIIARLQAEVDAKAAGQPTPTGTVQPIAPASPPSETASVAPSPLTSSPRKPKLVYPWKTGIYTTFFYIKDGETVFSSDTNIASTGFGNKPAKESGTDDPNDRNGYASGAHASRYNPFYVALPFNDLTYPDKAKKYVPQQWQRPPVDGKPVSSCKDHWVEIKTEDGAGHVCYAQWEDVGPLRYDHAEYVFGSERPNTYNRAGLDVSPAVADYLGLKDQKHPLTSWRFVDAEDVPPGQWLKLAEEAIIYTAMHQSSPDLAHATPVATKAAPDRPPITKLAPDSTKP